MGGDQKAEFSDENDTIRINQEIISIDDFCSLGNKLIEQNLFEEAISLYQTAGKLFPDSLAIKLNLGNVLELQRKGAAQQKKNESEGAASARQKDDLLAQQILSLATLYYRRRKISESIELLELSKYKNEKVSKTHFLLGKIYYEQDEKDKALDEFLKVRDLDPFYEDNYKYLANLFYERHRLQDSLQAWIDAYILSGGEDIAKNSYYQWQIRKLLNELNLDKERYNSLFNDRKQYFLSLIDALTVSKSAEVGDVAEGLDPIFLKFREMDRTGESSLNLAVELKKFPVMQGLADEDLVKLAQITSEHSARGNEVIFREEDLTEGIYFIHSGSIRIVKMTPFGEQLLSSLGTTEFFGEMDFIDSLHCSADAIANEDSVLFSMSKVRLEESFQSQKHIAVQFYWHFWKTLSQRIRETNERLKSFFMDANQEQVRKRMMEGPAGEAVTVDLQDKLAVLKDKGLSSKELRLLAAFSTEEFYKEGQNIFLEGDKGEKLYIILEGKVRISKYIPGVGEEALAILERGDFFGEMALIDHAPRSADARAHSDATVLPIESRLLNDILAKDVFSSYQFLSIICKILSRRLREINLKIYQWRMMTGGF